jgi:hypothetical protein
MKTNAVVIPIVPAILAHAQSRNVDVIGMEVRKAAEITTHFRSAVAYSVMQGAACPVLTFRSEKG